TSFGTDILVATVVAEWSNTLLKWLLMEDRPFWWVRETDVYGKGDLARFPKLRQTPLTCETGPGSPSGHVMGYGAVAYCLVVWFIKMFVKNNKKLSASTKSRVIVSAWILYGVTIVLVALSRLYVATHFPHQCLLGALGENVLPNMQKISSYNQHTLSGKSQFLCEKQQTHSTITANSPHVVIDDRVAHSEKGKETERLVCKFSQSIAVKQLIENAGSSYSSTNIARLHVRHLRVLDVTDSNVTDSNVCVGGLGVHIPTVMGVPLVEP
ncbi:unnamed protein product, partial [Timema podura]|nr:unnamed protein product [Timema podura]